MEKEVEEEEVVVEEEVEGEMPRTNAARAVCSDQKWEVILEALLSTREVAEHGGHHVGWASSSSTSTTFTSPTATIPTSTSTPPLTPAPQAGGLQAPPASPEVLVAPGEYSLIETCQQHLVTYPSSTSTCQSKVFVRLPYCALEIIQFTQKDCL